MNAKRRNAFTLIEVLIVVVIMAVLAATVIPQFTSSTKDAQNSSVEFNARTLRAQIELYAAHHNGTYPENSGTNANLKQLTSFTDVSGAIGESKTNHPFGPYVPEIPTNPFNKLSTVKSVTGVAKGDDSTGWQYDSATGGIWPNHKDWEKTTSTTTEN